MRIQHVAWDNEEQLRLLAKEYVDGIGAVNPYQGGLVHEEVSPGNYAVRTSECGAQIWVFSTETYGVKYLPSRDWLSRDREARAQRASDPYLSEVLAYLLPPGVTELYGTDASEWLNNFCYAEAHAFAAKHIYFKFDIVESGWTQLLEGW